MQVKPTNKEGTRCCFVFDYYRLSPFNCAVIGRFVFSLLAQFMETIPLTLRMNFCKIGDYGLEQFLQPFFVTMWSLASSSNENMSFNEFDLDFHGNHLTHKSVENLKRVLTSQNDPVTQLDLSLNFNQPTTNKYITLKHLIECLSHKKCSLRTLVVSSSGFTEQHMYHLVLLLVHSHSLQEPLLCDNSLITGFPLFCSGLKMNNCLTTLDLKLVTLSDDDILLFADALHQHSKISKLCLAGSNSFRSTIFLQFLEKLFHSSSQSCLCQGNVDSDQYYPAMKQLESYQASQRQNGFPEIQLKIYNSVDSHSSAAMAEKVAIEKMKKPLLTGEQQHET